MFEVGVMYPESCELELMCQSYVTSYMSPEINEFNLSGTDDVVPSIKFHLCKLEYYDSLIHSVIVDSEVFPEVNSSIVTLTRLLSKRAEVNKLLNNDLVNLRLVTRDDLYIFIKQPMLIGVADVSSPSSNLTPILSASRRDMVFSEDTQHIACVPLFNKDGITKLVSAFREE